MPYGICTVIFLALCINGLLHLVPMMLGHLDYCEWLFLYLVGLTVCGFNKILQICGCRMKGGKELLIVWANLDWIFPAVIICPTTEGGNLYLRCIVPIWSGFWRSELISLHCLLCNYLGGLTDTWFSLLPFSYLKMWMPHYLWNVNLGWFRGFLNPQLIPWSIISFTCHFHSSFLWLVGYYNHIHTWRGCICFPAWCGGKTSA